ncbi:MAG: SpoVA/SpoVAEb family sporulation membrane protein [Oscillospiraceae bacterium]|nr:SpoVA/SpoVAEb family sporulation membrane protein [Oscillospiraceae bacterium]
MIFLKAFLVGGLLCAAGQILIDRTRLTPARILTGYVVAGVLLSALGVYEPLVTWAGAGAMVPLTGFGHALAEGARLAVREDGLLGAIAGPIAGTAAGVEAAIVLSLLAALVSRPAAK